jgi:hypothetical protein
MRIRFNLPEPGGTRKLFGARVLTPLKPSGLEP